MKQKEYGPIGEEIIKQIFNKQFGIDCEPIPTSNTKTPDYLLKRNNKILGVCEVKTNALSDLSEASGWEKVEEPTGMYMKKSKDEEEVQRMVENSFKQLKQIEYPKILVIVDFDFIRNPDVVLKAVLTGIGSTGRVITCVTLQGVKNYFHSRHISNGRIKDTKKMINLYIWIDGHKKEIVTTYYFSDNIAGKKLYELIWNNKNLCNL